MGNRVRIVVPEPHRTLFGRHRALLDILPVKPLPCGLSPPAAIYPQVLEYTIPGLSRNKDYTITLREGCTNG